MSGSLRETPELEYFSPVDNSWHRVQWLGEEATFASDHQYLKIRLKRRSDAEILAKLRRINLGAFSAAELANIINGKF